VTTLEQFSKVLADLGVENAYNLDGGNSTMMLFKGVFINALHETTMRPLSDIIYFASASAPQGE
jgi:exopolysaccharide biosynthesis protein